MALSALDLLAVALSLGFIVVAWTHKQRARSKGLPHPPGPPGLPIVGNIRDVPEVSAFPWKTYCGWGRQYSSDIIRLNVLGTNIIVANSLRVVTDLLDKRSSIYSCRPRMVMLNELCGFHYGMAFVPYGNEWREQRKMARHEFNPSTVKKFRVAELRATREYLVRLRRQPERFLDDLRFHAARVIMSVGYDIDVRRHDDPWVATAELAAGAITATTNAGSYLVDVIPALKYLPDWFPGAGFQKEAKVWLKAVVDLRDAPFNVVKERLAAGSLGECAAKSMIENFVKESRDPKYSEFIAASSLGSLYVGGADTTVSSLGSFFLAMVVYPEVQEKARKELDRVLGGLGRLPDFTDQPDLPYIEAVVRESLRWQPVVPLDVPHRLIQDDVYDGYFLPKGSLVVGNSWAILHDEKMYPDPSTFNPDRFLKPDGTLDPDVLDPSAAAFGYGRRVCPGRYMAVDSIWIAIASILHTFEIGKAIGPDGRAITPEVECISGFLCHPRPFQCSIKPRSGEHDALIQELSHQLKEDLL